MYVYKYIYIYMCMYAYACRYVYYICVESSTAIFGNIGG